MEQRITREDYLVVAVLHVPADAVLGVARGVQALHGDAADLETLTIGRSLGDRLAVLPANNLEIWRAEVASLQQPSAMSPCLQVS